jgi:hypothetical protein
MEPQHSLGSIIAAEIQAYGGVNPAPPALEGSQPHIERQTFPVRPPLADSRDSAVHTADTIGPEAHKLLLWR